MNPVGCSGKNEWRAAAAALLGIAFLLSGAACGKKEGGGSPGAVGGPGTSGSVTAGPVGSGVTHAGGKDEVVFEPRFPTRITPPRISVKPVLGHEKEVTGVRWFVNGAETESGPRLSPSSFQRGDRIHAVVTLKMDGADKVVTTREMQAGNSPPVVTEVLVDPVNPVSGGTVRATAKGSDADDDPLKIQFEWFVDDVPVPGATDTLMLKGVKRGARVHARAIPNDGIADGAWGESPRYLVVNGPPVVKNQLPKEIPADGNFNHRIEAEDPDGDPLTYILKKGPPGMTLNGSTLAWQVPAGYYGQSIEIVVEISDGEDSRTVQKIAMTIQPPRKPQAAETEKRQEGM